MFEYLFEDDFSAPTPAPTKLPPGSVEGFQVTLLIMVGVGWCLCISLITVGTYTIGTCCMECAIDLYRETRSSLGLNSQPTGHVNGDDEASLSPGTELAESIPKGRGCWRGVEACSICLLEMEADDVTKELACSHCYHSDCLDQWLNISVLCPLCRKTARPAPIKPLSKQVKVESNDHCSMRSEGDEEDLSNAEVSLHGMPLSGEESKDDEFIGEIIRSDSPPTSVRRRVFSETDPEEEVTPVIVALPRSALDLHPRGEGTAV